MALTSEFLFLSTTEVAAETGLTDGRIRQMARSGEITAHKVGGRVYAIPKSEVDRIKKDRQPPKS